MAQNKTPADKPVGNLPKTLDLGTVISQIDCVSQVLMLFIVSHWKLRGGSLSWGQEVSTMRPRYEVEVREPQPSQ